jgi:hypothetical protein
VKEFSDTVTPSADTRSAFVPLLLMSLAVLCWLSFQSLQLVREREQLTTLRASQEAPLEAATKLRASLDAVAVATSRFADAGNPSARLIVDELRKRGITINQPAAAPGAPAK